MTRWEGVVAPLGGTVMTTFVVGTASVNAQRSGSEVVSVCFMLDRSVRSWTKALTRASSERRGW